MLHESSIHILAQKHKFDRWLKSDDSIVVANCLLVLTGRLVMMISRQIERQLEDFKAEGGFTEGLTAERLEYRKQQSAHADATVLKVEMTDECLTTIQSAREKLIQAETELLASHRRLQL